MAANAGRQMESSKFGFEPGKGPIKISIYTYIRVGRCKYKSARAHMQIYTVHITYISTYIYIRRSLHTCDIYFTVRIIFVPLSPSVSFAVNPTHRLVI